MADPREDLQNIFRMNMVDICGGTLDREFSGWMLIVCGVNLGVIKVWENPHEVEVSGHLFEENERLAEIVTKLCKPKCWHPMLRIVK
jgi:hypothetical protein